MTAARSALNLDDAVQVAYVATDGAERLGPLEQAWNVPFEGAAPVREFGSFKGQRNFSGAWWFATTGDHVGFESWLERDHVMLMDFDPEVVGLSSQPFWLSWRDNGRVRRHAPDFFVRYRDGSAAVIDVRPKERISPADAEVFKLTGRACATVGWGYHVVGTLDAVLASNVRWLSGYRHARCFNERLAARLQSTLHESVPLADVVKAVGDRLQVLPTLYHLMWTGAVRADLHLAPLNAATLLTSRLRAA